MILLLRNTSKRLTRIDVFSMQILLSLDERSRGVIDKNKLFHVTSTHYNSYSSSAYNSQFSMKKIKLITFDITGTLLGFRKPPFEIYADFGNRHELFCGSGEGEVKGMLKSAFRSEWKRMNKLHPHFGTCWETWWTELVIGSFQGAKVNGSEEKLKNVAAELIEYFKTDSCWKLKPGAMELISALKSSINENNIKARNSNLSGIGVISNFDPRLHILLKVFNLEHQFHPLMLSHELQISKPSPKIFNLALEEFKKEGRKNSQIEIQPGEALHVGDNYELDYVAAINAGWKACLIGELPVEHEHQGSIKDSSGGGIRFPDLKAFHNFLKLQGTVSA